MTVDPKPILPGFHPDPSVCRVGEDFYLACSSFEYFPGIPVFHSRDLIDWTLIGNALDRPSQLRLDATVPSSAGVYAPTLRHRDGVFYLVVTIVGGGGNAIITATDPAGPWSDPLWLPIEGIDPDIAWDDDGACWCTVAGISQGRIDPASGQLLSPMRRIWSGTAGAKAPEAPHLYHVDDQWYLLIAEGGTERGHGVSVARGPHPGGPFTPCPDNPILTHRGTDHPIQNTGHADLVQAADGSWWMVFLGVRPGGGSPGWHVLGRETFLAPVEWIDGWPRVGDIQGAAEDPGCADVDIDDFDAPDLAPIWISPRGGIRDHTTTQRPGWVTLQARGASLDERDVVMVARRQTQQSCQVRTKVDVSQGVGGLAVRLDERHHYSIEVDSAELRVVARIGDVRSVVGTRAVDDVAALILRIDILPTTAGFDPLCGPDTIVLGVEGPGGTFDVVARLDGRYLSTEVAGGFTGRVIGVFANSGTVHCDWVSSGPATHPRAD